MKLIIQIPCYNEEVFLPITLSELPRKIDGVDEIEWLIIDDGSQDNTIEVARKAGVDHIVRHTTNKGLAAAFQTGLNASLERGADIIVNTDADNQYPAQYIPDLIRPILMSKADIVIADRQVEKIQHFSRRKKFLQKLGSWVVRFASATEVPDAPSGFRALSREAALKLNVVTTYTYTLDTIIQAGRKNLTVISIPIHTNAKIRESRLIKSEVDYVIRSMFTILRLFILYQPLRLLTLISMIFFLAGSGLWIRYLIIVLLGDAGRGAHIQSIVVGSVALIFGLFIFLMGIIGDLISINRGIQEETLYHVKRVSLSGIKPPGEDRE